MKRRLEINQHGCRRRKRLSMPKTNKLSIKTCRRHRSFAHKLAIICSRGSNSTREESGQALAINTKSQQEVSNRTTNTIQVKELVRAAAIMTPEEFQMAEEQHLCWPMKRHHSAHRRRIIYTATVWSYGSSK